MAIGRGFAQGLEKGIGNFINTREGMKKNALDALKTQAELSNEGFDINQNPGTFGIGSTMSLTPNQSSLPKGFVRVGGKVMQDPTYQDPLDKAKTNYYNSMGGGSSTINQDPENFGQPVTLDNLDPNTRSMVKGILDYQIDPTKATSIRGNQRQQIIALASRIDPTYDMTQFPTRNKYRQEFSSGKIGQNIRSYNTAIQHLSELNDATNQVPSNPIMPLEAAQRFGAKTFAGDSSTAMGMQKESTALTAVAGELSNIFKNTGGTDQEINSWFKAYNPNSTRKAKQQFIKTGIDLMKGRVGAIGSDYERVMGKPYDKSIISPESESVTNKIFGGGSSDGKNFNSPDEADASGLPAGSIVTVQGKRYQI